MVEIIHKLGRLALILFLSWLCFWIVDKMIGGMWLTSYQSNRFNLNDGITMIVESGNCSLQRTVTIKQGNREVILGHDTRDGCFFFDLYMKENSIDTIIINPCSPVFIIDSSNVHIREYDFYDSIVWQHSSDYKEQVFKNGYQRMKLQQNIDPYKYKRLKYMNYYILEDVVQVYEEHLSFDDDSFVGVSKELLQDYKPSVSTRRLYPPKNRRVITNSTRFALYSRP